MSVSNKKPAARTLDELYDIVVVGAGPSGAAAALRARQLDCSVLLLDRAEFPRPRHCAGWIGPAGAAFCEQAGLAPRKCGAATFTGVTLRSWDLKKEAVVSESDLAGWVVDRSTFDHALVRLAIDAGTAWFAALSAEKACLREDRVELTMPDGRTARGRVLIIADGLDSPTARLVGIPTAGSVGRLPEALFCEAILPKAAMGVDLILAGGRSPALATLVRAGKQARLSVTARDAASLSTLFSGLIATLEAGGMLPAGSGAQPTRQRIPAGVALELETHVGKRTLVVGNAGGFVATFSGEGVYPAMRSGWIAAETAARAVRSPMPQDELAGFADAWRSGLAEYLRPPNTELALLLPLVFSNPQMSRRVTRAFLLGQAF